VRDLAFYNAGYHETKGIRRVVLPFRRALRRVLRPIFLRQVELYQEIDHELNDLSRRQDELAEQLKTTLAFGWDYVAMVRRLAVLEDQIASVTGTAAPIVNDAESRTSILSPGLTCAQDESNGEPEARSKVC
jgi:hypothetical protein